MILVSNFSAAIAAECLHFDVRESGWLLKQLKRAAWLSAVSSQSGRVARGARVLRVGARGQRGVRENHAFGGAKITRPKNWAGGRPPNSGFGGAVDSGPNAPIEGYPG